MTRRYSVALNIIRGIAVNNFVPKIYLFKIINSPNENLSPILQKLLKSCSRHVTEQDVKFETCVQIAFILLRASIDLNGSRFSEASIPYTKKGIAILQLINRRDRIFVTIN